MAPVMDPAPGASTARVVLATSLDVTLLPRDRGILQALYVSASKVEQGTGFEAGRLFSWQAAPLALQNLFLTSMQPVLIWLLAWMSPCWPDTDVSCRQSTSLETERLFVSLGFRMRSAFMTGAVLATSLTSSLLA